MTDKHTNIPANDVQDTQLANSEPWDKMLSKYCLGSCVNEDLADHDHHNTHSWYIQPEPVSYLVPGSTEPTIMHERSFT